MLRNRTNSTSTFQIVGENPRKGFSVHHMLLFDRVALDHEAVQGIVDSDNRSKVYPSQRKEDRCAPAQACEAREVLTFRGRHRKTDQLGPGVGGD